MKQLAVATRGRPRYDGAAGRSSHGRVLRRSSAFWGFWLVVAAAAIVAVSLTTGQNQADPKGTLAAIFGIIGLYLVAFFVVRRRAVEADKADDLKGARRGAQLPMDDPTALSDSELYGAMAIRPLDAAALKARAQTWDIQSKGMNSGAWIVVVIFLCVPPIYFFHTFVPTLVGALVIGTWALFKSFQLMGPRLAGVYELTDQVMAPLGLRVTERYTVSIGQNLARGGPAPVTTGALELQGERHGRHVKIRTPAGGARSTRTVEVTTGSSEVFELRARDGLFHARSAAPSSVCELIASLSRSPAWNGVQAQGKDGKVIVKRRGAAGNDPMLDLWLGEHLADALNTTSGGEQA